MCIIELPIIPGRKPNIFTMVFKGSCSLFHEILYLYYSSPYFLLSPHAGPIPMSSANGVCSCLSFPSTEKFCLQVIHTHICEI